MVSRGINKGEIDMTDKITEIVKAILKETPIGRISAETANTLHGCCAGHPWANGKTAAQRAQEAVFAVNGKDIRPLLKDRLYSAADRLLLDAQDG